MDVTTESPGDGPESRDQCGRGRVGGDPFVSDMADGTIGLTQSSNGWALVGALEGGQKLTPMLARIHWTLCEAPASEPWITTDNPVALFEPFPVRPKLELYGPSLQFLFPISPGFLLFGEPMTKGPDDRGRMTVVRTATATVVPRHGRACQEFSRRSSLLGCTSAALRTSWCTFEIWGPNALLRARRLRHAVAGRRWRCLPGQASLRSVRRRKQSEGAELRFCA